MAALLNEKQTARMLNCSVSLLRKWRVAGRGGPDYRKLGRSVRYIEVDVFAFLEARRVRGNVSRQEAALASVKERKTPAALGTG